MFALRGYPRARLELACENIIILWPDLFAFKKRADHHLREASTPLLCFAHYAPRAAVAHSPRYLRGRHVSTPLSLCGVTGPP